MRLFIPRKDHSSPNALPQELRANWQAIEKWANGRIQVLSFGFPAVSSNQLTTPFISPYPIEILAVHVFLPTLGTTDSVFDLLKNGASVLSSTITVPHTGNGWVRVSLPKPIYLVSIADFLASRAAIPDSLIAKCVTAGTGAANPTLGVEYQ